ncbi:MAG: amidase, partial [Rhodospirillales bacterium]|nr:amidase [Rhodospirillales bacterium]
MISDLHFMTIAEASALIRARQLSPVELTRNFLDRIAALDAQLNAYILPLADRALAEAKQAEAEIAGGRYKGPLHGIPIGLKDIYNTAGIATTGPSALFRDHVPTEDAFTVALLREAGAITLGKLSTWEFAIGGASFDLPWPPARNPWNTAREPGGSSSGSGAAVAAGLAMAAMGTDTGGSIRGPASWCGISGLKPTYGYLSRRGILPLSPSLDHAGPMCWTSEDCALMMQVLARHDPQ